MNFEGFFNNSTLIFVLKIILFFSLIVLVFSIFRNIRGKKVYKKGYVKSFIHSDFMKKLNVATSKNFLFFKLKENYTRKINIINTKSREENELFANFGLLICFLIPILIGISMLFYFVIWYIVVIITAIIIGFFLYGTNYYLKIRLLKIYKQFPEALQIFTDEYISNKNIKVALINSYGKMPKEIGIVFEKLTRQLSSSYNFEKPIKDFAKSLDYIWAYSFAELLLISLNDAGEISEELIFLNELINDGILTDAEDQAELAGNKIVFIFVNAVTIITFFINMFFCPIGKELYFYTMLGNLIILVWISSFLVGILSFVLMDRI